MRTVLCSMNVSLDGYIVGPDGGLDWAPPDEELFHFVTEETRGLGGYLLGRRLYETMLYWEPSDRDPTLTAAQRDWATVWRTLPKVVFSRTLSAVQGNTRLASGRLEDEIARIQAEQSTGEIAVGGATLALQVAELGLLDEYRMRVCPVLVGGGVPFFPQLARRVDLALVETRTFASQVVYLRYRVKP